MRHLYQRVEEKELLKELHAEKKSRVSYDLAFELLEGLGPENLGQGYLRAKTKSQTFWFQGNIQGSQGQSSTEITLSPMSVTQGRLGDRCS